MFRLSHLFLVIAVPCVLVSRQ